MTQLSEIQAQHALGVTDVDAIATALRANPRHKRDTNAAALYQILVNEFGVLRGSGNAASGLLEDHMVALPSAYAALVDGYRQFVSNPWSDSAAIRATLPQIGSLVSAITAITAGIVDARNDGVTTGQQVEDAVELLTGGQVNDGLTGVGVQAILDAEAVRVATVDATPDRTEHETLISVNSTAAKLTVVTRVTPIYYLGDQLLRRGVTVTTVNDAALVEQMAAIMKGLN